MKIVVWIGEVPANDVLLVIANSAWVPREHRGVWT
jgi:hypothetical protein